MKIESQQAKCNATPSQVFEFLMDMENIKKLLPQDKISDWQSDDTSCSFKVQNMAKIPLVRTAQEEGKSITFTSGDGSPFPFTLDVNMAGEGDNASSTSLIFDGKVNAFLEMMVKKPLSNLFDYMADKLVKEFE